MSVLNKIRDWFSEVILKNKIKNLPERRRKTFNLEEARVVGVIYNGSDPTKNLIVQDFIRFLLEERKQVHCLAFLNKKEVDDSYLPMKEVSAFCVKDLNFLQFPKKMGEQFFQNDIDILIDLSIEEETPLKYLFSVSPAKFKVSGALSYQRDFGDMTIEIKKNQGLEYLIEQITHYINLVNSKKTTYAV